MMYDENREDAINQAANIEDLLLDLKHTVKTLEPWLVARNLTDIEGMIQQIGIVVMSLENDMEV